MSQRIRSIQTTDIETVCRHREEMFAVSGHDRDMLARMTEAFRVWLAPRLNDGTYFGWFIEEDEKPIAGLGMMVIDWPPHPAHPEDARRGYILNVFVEPEHRCKGLAKILMNMADVEAAERGLGYLILHATKQGRPLYEKLGWRATSEMAVRR